MTTDAKIGSESERRAQGVIELIVPELASALSFYAKLGFTVERCTAGFAALSGYGCRLFLAQDLAAERVPVRGCNLRIIVNDVDAVYRHVLKTGVPITREPADRSYGLRDFSMSDPNGFILRFAQVVDV